MTEFDFDWVIVGSGFGGSTAALRLSEKGYSVAVLEAGRRFADADFATSAWNLRRFLYMPAIGLRGIMRIYWFKDVTILAGAGVGGGSLVYANTLYEPGRPFFEAPEWAHLADWETELKPHYAVARRMLGASEIPFRGAQDDLIQELGVRMGVGDTYRRPEVSVFFGPAGAEGQTFADPFFDGAGPDRTACVRCGACMVGCRYGAKNTLVKNYLHLAEGLGVTVMADRTVKRVQPIGAADGSDGYLVSSVTSGGWGRGRQQLRARGVIISAGPIGTNWLLARCRRDRALPRLSDQLGSSVRTNSEALLAVTAKDDRLDLGTGVAISSSIYPEQDTHIENCMYGRAGNFMSLLFVPLTGDGGRLTRPWKLLANSLRRPADSLRILLGRRTWSQRTIILLVMQTRPGRIALRSHRLGRRILLSTRQDPDHPNPTYIPAANRAAEMLAEQIGGIAQSNITEATSNIPATAHVLGGAVIAEGPDHGVVDRFQRVFGYENLIICDGSVVPANPGVNPSLTITALAEHAMSAIPAKDTSPHEQMEQPNLEARSAGFSGLRLGKVDV